MYPPELVAPLAKDLTDFGFTSLTTQDEVTQILGKKEGTVLLVVNSVCGCAAANARPAAKMSVKGEHKPDNMVTVFAGVDRDATEKARVYLLPYPPSSPTIALFKDDKLVHMLERRHIEGNSAAAISANLEDAFSQYCS